MNATSSADLLNRAWRCESIALLARLADAHLFVSWAMANELPVLEQIVSDDRDCAQRLLDELDRYGGVPLAPPPDARIARYHYVALRYILPVLVGDRERLVACYRALLSQTPQPGAAAAFRQNLDSHERNLAILRSLAQQPATP